MYSFFHWLFLSWYCYQKIHTSGTLLCLLQLTHWGRVTYICISKIITIGSDNGLSPSHYQNQCCNIVNWGPRNKLQLNFNRNSYKSIQENPFENVVWKMSAILPQPQCVNSSPPGQNGRHSGDDIFRCIFLNENVCIFIKISLKFVSKGSIDNNPALVQIMVWHRIGDKLLSEPMLTRFTEAYMWL